MQIYKNSTYGTFAFVTNGCTNVTKRVKATQSSDNRSPNKEAKAYTKPLGHLLV